MKTQKGYIRIVLVVFALIMGLLIFPIKFPKSINPEGQTTTVATKCMVGEASDGSLLKNIPAIKDTFDPAIPGSSDNLELGGPDPSEKTDFVLVRKNVPTTKNSTPAGWVFLGGTVATNRTHTINVGEIPEKPGYDAYYPLQWGEIDLPVGTRYMRNMGIIFFANRSIPAQQLPDGNQILMLDVYQDKRIFDDKSKDYNIDDLLICGKDGAGDTGPNSVLIPPQQISTTKDQLQLEWFLFGAPAKGVWAVHCKPAVYLYPSEKQLVNVKVFPAGTLMYADPPYDKEKGWTVWAEPSGKLSALGSQSSAVNKVYDYLYFESKVRDEVIEKPTKGWVVKYDDLTKLYQEILPKLGLNEAQKNDFIEYWNKALIPAPYYFVGIIDQNNVDEIERLEITPKPDSVNRVRIYFERLDAPKSVKAPELSLSREGRVDLSSQTSAESRKQSTEGEFKVVEWGGMVKNDPNHPFTCSQ